MQKISELRESINELRSATKKTEKKDVLAKYMNDKEFEFCLRFYLNDRDKTNLKRKKMENVLNKFKISPRNNGELEDLINWSKELSVMEGVNEQVVQDLLSDFIHLSDEDFQFVIDFISKDLTLGTGAKQVNEYYPGFLYVHEVIKGRPMQQKEEYREYMSGKKVLVSTKYDGYRGTYVTSEEEILSTQGNPLSIPDVLADFGNFNINKFYDNKPITFDGELLLVNWEDMSSKEAYELTKSQISSKKRTENVMFVIFDAFVEGDTRTYKERVNWLMENLPGDSRFVQIADFKNIKDGNWSDIIWDTDMTEIELRDEASERDMEGFMVANADWVIKKKTRIKDLLKIKKFDSLDLKVVGYNLPESGKWYRHNEGVTEDEYVIRSINVQVTEDGDTCSVTIGNEEWQKMSYYKENFENKIVEIEFCEVTSNKQGEVSLRDPRFLRIRDDKDLSEAQFAK